MPRRGSDGEIHFYYIYFRQHLKVCYNVYMEVREIFTSNFFIAIIAISSLLVVLTFFLTIQSTFWENYKRRRMEIKITSMKDHYIINGFGRVGRQIAQELAEEKTPFVVIDKEEVFDECKKNGWPYIHGDSSKDEEVLKKAGIANAKALLIAVGSDADSVFIAVSARSLNPDLFIVARASSQDTADKLKKLGVNRVALPYQIGGYHMAVMAMRPAVVDFIDTIFDSRHDELHVEELQIEEKSQLKGMPLRNVLPRDKKKVAVLAVKRAGVPSIVNPPPDTILQAGDDLILMGTKQDLDQIGEEFSP